eukprot:g61248.t1
MGVRVLLGDQDDTSGHRRRMSGGGNFSLTTFNKNGKLVQIEYALEAVAKGGTSLGIKATNGVVIATEKKAASSLVDAKAYTKMHNLTENMGVTYAGMGPDTRVLIRKGRKAAQTYWLTYKDQIPCSQLVREVAQVMQEFTQQGGVRPFGASLLLAGYDDEGPQLYQIDPSGAAWAWKASAIGKNYTHAKTFLEKRYDPTMELEDAIHTAILTLKEGFEGALTEDNVEIAVVDKSRKFRILSPAEVKDYLGESYRFHLYDQWQVFCIKRLLVKRWSKLRSDPAGT